MPCWTGICIDIGAWSHSCECRKLGEKSYWLSHLYTCVSSPSQCFLAELSFNKYTLFILFYTHLYSYCIISKIAQIVEEISRQGTRIWAWAQIFHLALMISFPVVLSRYLTSKATACYRVAAEIITWNISMSKIHRSFSQIRPSVIMKDKSWGKCK